MSREGSSRSASAVGTLSALIGVVVLLLLTACDRVVGPLAEFTATPQYDYPPLEVTLDASASTSPNGAIVSYNWNLGDGEIDSGVFVTHTYTKKGVYEITLVVTDSAGEIGARTRSVEALNRMPVASFEVDKYWVGDNQPIEFDASDSYDPDGEIVQYVWSFGDGSSAEGMVVQHEYGLLNGGSWQPTVTLTVIDENGGPNSTTRKVNVVGCGSCG